MERSFFFSPHGVAVDSKFRKAINSHADMFSRVTDYSNVDTLTFLYKSKGYIELFLFIFTIKL